MYLIDKKNRVLFLLKCSDHAFKALLEISAKFGTGQHPTQIQRIDSHIFQQFRNFSFLDFLRQPFSHCGFTDAGVPDKNRIVFPPSAKHLNGPFQLKLPTDEWIQFSEGSPGNKIDGKKFEWIRFFLFLAFFRLEKTARRLSKGGIRHPVRDIV